MSDYLHWHVGMKVVCLTTHERLAAVRAIEPDGNYPAPNGVYTLRQIRDDARWGGKGIVVLLSEFDNSHLIGRRYIDGGFHVEPGFPASSFRPVQTRNTDISIFTAMLNEKHVRSPVEAA